MTKEQAIKKQKELSEKWELGWWYGTACEKCCGFYPKLMKSGPSFDEECYYQCEVCGKRTEAALMPWISRDAWNNHDTFYPDGGQIKLEEI